MSDEEKCCKINFFQSFADSVGKISNDPTIASSETIEERLKVCHSCDKLNKELGVCKECGCIVKLKTRFAAVNCPIGKW